MQVQRHAPGSFCWFELATTDQAQAKTFYASLFGWAPGDQPIGPTEMYSIFRKDGRDAAAAYTMRAEQRAQSIPPNWLVYVAVDNVDRSAARASAAGGVVLAPPFDVMESGRMTVIADPTGATFAMWEPHKHAGTGVAQEHGTGVWADLITTDQTRAARFYEQLFDWKIVAGKNMQEAAASDYAHIVNGQDFIGGIPPAAFVPPGVPPYWLVYFSVPDCDATVRQTTEGGGRVLMPATTVDGVGRFATLADPQGAVFAIMQPPQ